MPTSPKVPCHPYFKLRRLTPHFQIGPQAPAPWNVPNLCAAYNWPTGLAGGGVIAIVELGGGWVQSDIDQYFKSINQPVPQITDVSVDGTQNSPNQSPGSNSDPDYEVALDIEVSAAAYYAATGKARDHPHVLVAGHRLCRPESRQRWLRRLLHLLGSRRVHLGHRGRRRNGIAAATATALGMVVFAASGDNDSSDGGSTPANVDAPSSCPHVVGCGGTYKTSTVETVWNDSPGQTNGEGTGGGYSTIFPVQSWQIGAPPPPANSHYGKGRMVPDVSADADPNTGYNVVVHGSTTVVGGTSAVAPLYAGLFAAFGKKLGFVTPSLYQNQGRLSTTSPAAATATTTLPPAPTPAPASAPPSATSSPPSSPNQPSLRQAGRILHQC